MHRRNAQEAIEASRGADEEEFEDYEEEEEVALHEDGAIDGLVVAFSQILGLGGGSSARKRTAG